MRSRRFEATGLELVERVLTSAYTRTRLTTTSSSLEGHVRVEQLDLGPHLQLHRADLGVAAVLQARPVPGWVFAHVLGGRTTSRTRRAGTDRETTHGYGQVHLSSGPDRPFWARVDQLVVESAVLSPALLEQVAEPASAWAPSPTGPVRFTDDRPVSHALGQCWVRTCDVVRGQLRTTRPSDDLAVASTARLLAGTALAVFPNTTWGSDGLRRDSRDAHAATYQRARRFIDDHADQDTSPAEVAAACAVSVRALRLAFRRHGDTTPSAHLRLARLARAHADLLDALALPAAAPADPRAAVVRVARRWGFVSVRAFEDAYRAAYGCTPAQALHLRRPLR